MLSVENSWRENLLACSRSHRGSTPLKPLGATSVQRPRRALSSGCHPLGENAGRSLQLHLQLSTVGGDNLRRVLPHPRRFGLDPLKMRLAPVHRTVHPRCKTIGRWGERVLTANDIGHVREMRRELVESLLAHLSARLGGGLLACIN